METKLICGNCLDVMKTFPDNHVDSICVDPPYGLSFMGKKWDYDVPSVDIWKECLRVLKPGGYLLSFAGTRTQHRMAVNIEDAGFEIRDMIAWVYGSGFPKSHNIGKAVDKLQGNNRQIVSVKETKSGGMAHIMKTNKEQGFRPNDYYEKEGNKIEISKGSSEWEGWGTALKPAVEPISVCQKPLQLNHIFAILIDDIWKHLPALDATNNLRDTQAKLNEVVNSVPENVRTNFLENINNVGLAGLITMSQKTNSKEEKESSAPENVKELDSEKTQEKKTQTGEVEDATLMDISTSVQMGNISESIVLLWKNISEELLNQANMLTTSMAIKKITELRILKFCLLQSISTNTGNSKKITPNLEPITVARKPLSEKTVAKNVLKHGTGGINIDECRVGTKERTNQPASSLGNNKTMDGGKANPNKEPTTTQGRFPANLIHDGSEEVVELFPETGKSTGGRANQTTSDKYGIYANNFEKRDPGFGDSGSASRFFYCAKSSRAERLLDGFNCATIEVCKNQEENTEQVVSLVRDILDLAIGSLSIGGFGGNKTDAYQTECLSTIRTTIKKITELKTWNSLMQQPTGDFIQDVICEKTDGINPVNSAEKQKELMTKIGIFQEKVGSITEDVKNVTLKSLLKLSEEDAWSPASSHHPTHKPIKLMQYLVRLVTPKGGIVLDPFMGSGSTGRACVLEGFDFIGIEMDADYIKIAEARVKNVQPKLL